jgi:hypothetical protein
VSVPAPQPPKRAAPIVALVLACLFIVPLAPLAGCVMGLVLLKRTPRDQPRGLAILSSAIGAAVFVLAQVLPALLIASMTRALISDLHFAEPRVNVPLVAKQIQQYARLHQHRMPPTGDWAPPGEPRCPFKTAFAGNDPVWHETPWRELLFSVPAQHAWQYRVALTGEPGALWAEARADVDCRGDVRIVRMKVRESDRDPLETITQ